MTKTITLLIVTTSTSIPVSALKEIQMFHTPAHKQASRIEALSFVTPSSIHHKQRRHQGVVNGRWVIEADACPYGLHGAGTCVADAAPGEPDDMTFTAPDGNRYFDVPSRVQWTPREA